MTKKKTNGKNMKDTKKAAKRISKIIDRLDVLINNAGAHFPKYIEIAEGFESTLALNYLSPFLFTHHLIEQMEQTASEHGEARIINISSVITRQINSVSLKRHSSFLVALL